MSQMFMYMKSKSSPHVPHIQHIVNVWLVTTEYWMGELFEGIYFWNSVVFILYLYNSGDPYRTSERKASFILLRIWGCRNELSERNFACKHVNHFFHCYCPRIVFLTENKTPQLYLMFQGSFSRITQYFLNGNFVERYKHIIPSSN